MIIPLVLAQKFLNSTAKHGVSISIFTGFCAWFVGFIDNGIIAVIWVIDQLFDGFNLEAFYGVNFSALQYVGIANSIVPLSEFVALSGIYLTSAVTIITIRWFKSFIPSLA